MSVGMNWEAIGVVAAVVGAIAVVISWGYLAIQVRSNTHTLKASPSLDSTHSRAATNELLVSAIAAESGFQTSGNSRLVDITAKFYRDWARGIVALPMGREWWNGEQKSSICSPEFASIISNSPEADVTIRPAGLRDAR